MRKFLCEYDSIVTMEELQSYYNESSEKEYESFSQYLENCLGKNGSLVEIRTSETPNNSNAVTLYRVAYSDDIDDTCDMWLTDKQAARENALGHTLTKI